MTAALDDDLTFTDLFCGAGGAHVIPEPVPSQTAPAPDTSASEDRAPRRERSTVPNRPDRGERRGGPAERERLDATLVALEAHLTTSGVPPDTAQLLCTTARRVLRGQERAGQLGWLLAVHGDDTCRHVPSTAVWDLVIAAGGRLTYLVDLGHWWAVACAAGGAGPARPRQIAS